jgi:predicted DNA-binding transcriptional regulator AlpA
MIVLELDREAAAHVAMALTRQIGVCRDAGLPVPDGLRVLRDAATRAAKAGQSRSDTVARPESVHPTRQAVPDVSRRFFNRKEVAAMTGLSERTIRRRIDEGALHPTPLGIPKAEIERLAQYPPEKRWSLVSTSRRR